MEGCHSFWFGNGLINTVTGKLALGLTRAELFTSIVEVVDMDCFNPTDSFIFVSNCQGQRQHDLRGSSPP